MTQAGTYGIAPIDAGADYTVGLPASYYEDIQNAFVGEQGRAMAAEDAMAWVRTVKAEYEKVHAEAKVDEYYSHLFGRKELLVDNIAPFSGASVKLEGDLIFKEESL